MTQRFDPRPHSRACGPLCRGHGPACHTNCPTCHGKPIAAYDGPLPDPQGPAVPIALVDDGAAPTVPIETLPTADLGAPVMLSLQQASAGWVRAKYPGHDVWHRLAKLTEEIGELNRALIGVDEHRLGRGDPQQEAAQVLLVLLSIADMLGFDLLDAGMAEFKRAVGG